MGAGQLRDPLGRFDPQALLCTAPGRDPPQIVRWFVRRWQLEVTFREARDHLGVETQRQWSDRAIARTTPCLLGSFSLVALLATRLTPEARLAVATAAWYRKTRPTFSDTLAAVRRHIWAEQGFATSRHEPDVAKLRPACARASSTPFATPHETAPSAKAELSSHPDCPSPRRRRTRAV